MGRSVASLFNFRGISVTTGFELTKDGAEAIKDGLEASKDTIEAFADVEKMKKLLSGIAVGDTVHKTMIGRLKNGEQAN